MLFLCEIDGVVFALWLVGMPMLGDIFELEHPSFFEVFWPPFDDGLRTVHQLRYLYSSCIALAKAG